MGIDDVDELRCDRCGATVDPDEADRSGTYGDLDPGKWRTLCCPDCGQRLKTVFVRPDG